MPPEPYVYEARFASPKTARLAIILLAFCAVVLVLPASLLARIVVVVPCGIGLVILLAAGLSRKTALRVDADGVRLCQSPFFRSAAAFYPWADLRKILLWRYQRLQYIGVERREGAPEPTGAFAGPASRAAVRRTAPGIEPGVALTGAAANTWALDRKRLVAAVAHFAPAVEVVDTTTSQVLHPGQSAPPPAELSPPA